MLCCVVLVVVVVVVQCVVLCFALCCVLPCVVVGKLIRVLAPGGPTLAAWQCLSHNLMEIWWWTNCWILTILLSLTFTLSYVTLGLGGNGMCVLCRHYHHRHPTPVLWIQWQIIKSTAALWIQRPFNQRQNLRCLFVSVRSTRRSSFKKYIPMFCANGCCETVVQVVKLVLELEYFWKEWDQHIGEKLYREI